MKRPLIEALKCLSTCITPLCVNESVPLMKAFGRISAKTIKAAFDIPPHPISLRDGRLVSYEVLEKKLSISNLPRINTGEKVPNTTACIIEEESLERVDFESLCPDECFIKAQGEDIQKGTTLLKKGSKIGPFDITNLASQGMHTVTVLKEARIAYVGIGDELIDVNVAPRFGYIYNSNAYTMAARGEMMGARTATITNANDSKDAILRTFEALEHVDAIVTSGGMSPRDTMHKLLEKEILKPLFKGVAMAPAGLTALSFYNETPILHLPGLPMSALLGFEVIGAALIRRLYGMDEYANIITHTTLPIKAHPFSQSIVPGDFDGKAFTPRAIAAGMINVLNYCNGFIVVNTAKPLSAKDEVIFHPFLHWH
ncbi:MAG: hypothetical protein GX780_03495 [Campylobacteraceae bacterium]|nr:hypothetical protein [Campylobacteraceae bacterium]